MSDWDFAESRVWVEQEMQQETQQETQQGLTQQGLLCPPVKSRETKVRSVR